MSRNQEEPLHNRVEEARSMLGLSRSDLAEEVGVHYQTIGYIERGEYNPSLSLALKLAKALRVEGIEICGKTGTAENFAIIDGKKTQLTDHSIFVAFAPKDNPKIAIAVFVENGYWGSRFAGRMASLMIEKYIKGHITRTDLENWILTHSLEDEYAKPLSGEPFKINKETTLQVIDNYAIKPEEQEPLKQ